MSDPAITIVELEAICHQAAATFRQRSEKVLKPGGFYPTANQVYFFTLVWLLKRKVPFQKGEERLSSQEAASLPDHVLEVAHHLDESGVIVTCLKQREAKGWQLLRIQMEKALSYYDCQREVKAEALQEALIKIFKLLDKMVDGPKLDQTEDIVALVVNSRSSLTNIYDFRGLFYAFAKQIARNELASQLKKENRQPLYPDLTEDMPPVSPSPPPPDDETEAQLLQLKIDLTRLLESMQCCLTRKPRQVVCHTLAAQPLFWDALKMTSLATPADFPAPAKCNTDAHIAAALRLTENSVRAHRSQAKKRIQEFDPLLGLLFERLSTRRDGRARMGQREKNL